MGRDVKRDHLSVHVPCTFVFFRKAKLKTATSAHCSTMLETSFRSFLDVETVGKFIPSPTSLTFAEPRNNGRLKALSVGIRSCAYHRKNLLFAAAKLQQLEDIAKLTPFINIPHNFLSIGHSLLPFARMLLVCDSMSIITSVQTVQPLNFEDKPMHVPCIFRACATPSRAKNQRRTARLSCACPTRRMVQALRRPSPGAIPARVFPVSP